MPSPDTLREAQDPRCKPERLRRLASLTEEVRRAVAANPNTPAEVLVRLAVRYPQEVLQNPVLDLLLLVNPNWLAEIPAFARNRLLAQPSVPVGFLRWAAGNGDLAALQSLAQNPSTPPELLEPLLTSPLPGVAEAARLHLSLETCPYETALWWLEADADPLQLRQLALVGLIPGWLMPRLVREPDPTLREYLAASGQTPPELLEALLLDENEEVRRAAQANPATPREALERFTRLELGEPAEVPLELLARGHPWARTLVARYPYTPPGLLEQLSGDEDWRVRAAAAANPGLEPGKLLRLAGDSDPDVRLATAANPRTPAEALERLASDENERVRAAAAANPSLPVRVLELLSRAEAQDAALPSQELGRMAALSEWARRIAAGHPNAPAETLERCHADSDWHTRLAVARNPNAAPPLLAALAADPDPDVRQAVARHPNTPRSWLERLATDDQPDVRAQILVNPALPEALMVRLATDDHWKVRQAVAAHPFAPPEVLVRLATDPDPDVRQAVADHPNVPEAALEPLFSGWFAGLETELSLLELYRRAKRLAPELPPHLLSQLAAGSEWARRLAARHPNTLGRDLERLAGDEDWRVRQAVAENPRIRSGVLEALATDPDADVRKAVARHPQVSAASLALLAQDEHLEVRLLVAARLEAPLEALAWLAGDDDEAVRQAARANPSLPVGILDAYRRAEAFDATLDLGFLAELAGRGLYARALAAQNPATPQALLAQLCQDAEWRVRQAAALNPCLPRESLEGLTSDPDRDVRQAVARHPGAWGGLLARLLADPDEGVRLAALQHPRLDADTLAHYREQLLVAASRSRFLLNRAVALASPQLPLFELTKVRHRAAPEWLVRLALARNPKTPPEVLAELAQDGNRWVRTEAEKGLKAKGDGPA
ncbi:MAG: hypothetical protein K6T57_08390 [Thermaceae bacterium]|nr:hypothetical protein [Thermaceae bacterium]